MDRRQALKLFTGLALCPLCGGRGLASEGHWSYDGATGPEKWGDLDATDAPCSAGGQQSPIDITGTIIARQPTLKIEWSKQPNTVINNGHTIQLEVPNGDTLRMGNRTYTLKQFHFHHPSEHLVEGKRFAMEAHFVHAATDGLAVVAVLMGPGRSGGSGDPFHPAIAGAARILPLRGIADHAALQRDGRLDRACPPHRGG